MGIRRDHNTTIGAYQNNTLKGVPSKLQRKNGGRVETAKREADNMNPFRVLLSRALRSADRDLFSFTIKWENSAKIPIRHAKSMA